MAPDYVVFIDAIAAKTAFFTGEDDDQEIQLV